MTTERNAETGPDETGRDETGPDLVLGPMLRYIGETSATVWVETDRECQVEILGRTAATFEVSGHHYGLVLVDGLAPGSETEYQVALDGVVRWPLPGSEFPPSVLRTLSPDRPVRLAFGSCRVAEIAPWNLSRRVREQAEKEQAAAGTCALNAEAATLRGVPRDRWPDTLLMIGDQVYGDEPGPATREFMAARRRAAAAAAPAEVEAEVEAQAEADKIAAPDNEVADFEEYCALYREAWSQPAVRWLFSVIPTAMIFDDHDVHDDWNTSAQWRAEVTAKPWWGKRIESAFQSYWVYQHLGNLSPAELSGDDTWGKVRQRGDAAPVLADLARRADRRAPDVRFSFARAFGGVRVIMLDSRSRRVLDGTRLIVDDAEWQWCTEAVTGDWEHVVLASSVPPLLPRGIHTLEAWNEQVSGGAWGRRAARFGERQRQALDLEHWPAFGESFIRLERLLGELATGQRSPGGRPPASVTIISGDIHHSYLAAVDLPRQIPGAPGDSRARSAVYEAVCSPFHQAMPPKMVTAQKIASSRLGGLLGTAISSLAGAHIPKMRWRVTEGPWFENMIAVLEYTGSTARVRFDRARSDAAGAPRLELARAARLT